MDRFGCFQVLGQSACCQVLDCSTEFKIVSQKLTFRGAILKFGPKGLKGLQRLNAPRFGLKGLSESKFELKLGLQVLGAPKSDPKGLKGLSVSKFELKLGLQVLRPKSGPKGLKGLNVPRFGLKGL